MNIPSVYLLIIFPLQNTVRDARPRVCRVRHAEEGFFGCGGRSGSFSSSGQDGGTIGILPATDQQSWSHLSAGLQVWTVLGFLYHS